MFSSIIDNIIGPIHLHTLVKGRIICWYWFHIFFLCMYLCISKSWYRYDILMYMWLVIAFFLRWYLLVLRCYIETRKKEEEEEIITGKSELYTFNPIKHFLRIFVSFVLNGDLLADWLFFCSNGNKQFQFPRMTSIQSYEIKYMQ